jgi:hypothetical protein
MIQNYCTNTDGKSVSETLSEQLLGQTRKSETKNGLRARDFRSGGAR